MADPNTAPPKPVRRSPQDVAQRVADIVRSGIVILFYLLLSATALAAAWVSLRALIWCVQLATRALGEVCK